MAYLSVFYKSFHMQPQRCLLLAGFVCIYDALSFFLIVLRECVSNVLRAALGEEQQSQLHRVKTVSEYSGGDCDV